MAPKVYKMAPKHARLRGAASDPSSQFSIGSTRSVPRVWTYASSTSSRLIQQARHHPTGSQTHQMRRLGSVAGR